MYVCVREQTPLPLPPTCGESQHLLPKFNKRFYIRYTTSSLQIIYFCFTCSASHCTREYCLISWNPYVRPVCTLLNVALKLRVETDSLHMCYCGVSMRLFFSICMFITKYPLFSQHVLQDHVKNWRETALILTSILFLASGIWFIGNVVSFTYCHLNMKPPNAWLL